jgi:glycine/D-amino acid oxidase-like deaminating enzyme
MSPDQSSLPVWGTPPWVIEFSPPPRELPTQVDVAVVGAGFTGLAAAAWLRLYAPEKSVVLLEAGAIGHGASGRTGGMALGETAAGDFPGLGDVLEGVQHIFKTLGVECGLALPGAWEVSHNAALGRAPLDWQDSGPLRVAREVPGGTLDSGRLVSGLGAAAQRSGAAIFEYHRVTRARWTTPVELDIAMPEAPAATGRISAGKVLCATNALSLPLSGLDSNTHPKLTLAALSAPLTEQELESVGLAAGNPFYTVDLPYLWGRTRPDRSIVWGAGLVGAPPSGDLEEVRIDSPEPARLFANFENRVRGLHPALKSVAFTHRWGGPILFRDDWRPVFDWHPQTRDAVVIGAFAGHGVALSSYLGVWAAEALLGRRDLPEWGRLAR